MAISTFVAAGFLCKQERRSGFKLALVVGHREEKVRVRYWRAASKQWTKPVLIDPFYLDHILQADRDRHGKTIATATAAATGSSIVTRVWS